MSWVSNPLTSSNAYTARWVRMIVWTVTIVTQAKRFEDDRPENFSNKFVLLFLMLLLAIVVVIVVTTVVLLQMFIFKGDTGVMVLVPVGDSDLLLRQYVTGLLCPQDIEQDLFQAGVGIHLA